MTVNLDADPDYTDEAATRAYITHLQTAVAIHKAELESAPQPTPELTPKPEPEPEPFDPAAVAAYARRRRYTPPTSNPDADGFDAEAVARSARTRVNHR